MTMKITKKRTRNEEDTYFRSKRVLVEGWVGLSKRDFEIMRFQNNESMFGDRCVKIVCWMFATIGHQSIVSEVNFFFCKAPIVTPMIL
jgi:hypothetical protein